MNKQAIIKQIVVGVFMCTLLACESKDNVLSEQVSPSGLAYTHINMPGNSRITIRVAWPSSRAYETNQNPAVPRIATRLIFAGGATGYPAGPIMYLVNCIFRQSIVLRHYKSLMPIFVHRHLRKNGLNVLKINMLSK